MPGNVRNLNRVRRVAAALLVALMALVVAVTPLNAVVHPGDFELPIRNAGFCGNRQAAALLHDETGLVQGLALSMPSGASQLAPTRALLVDWEGDSDVTTIWMEFYARDGGYKLAMTTSAAQCSIGTALTFRFLVLLRAPVDPAQVVIVRS